jgi:AAA domain, putative AbiEii toxin, Type IV TA system/Overcoming lysogenization defect protein-like, TOPRIM domain
MGPEVESKSQPGIAVTSITFSDGSCLEFGRGDIIALVGPNNSGKSVALAEIYAEIGRLPESVLGKVVTSVEMERRGTAEEVLDYIAKVSVIEDPSARNLVFGGLGYQISASNIKSWWQSKLNNLREAFCTLLTTEKRLNACSPPSSIQLTVRHPEHPIHVMQRDDTEEKRISGFFRQAFNAELIVHRNAGANVPLYCGSSPKIEPPEDRASLSYAHKLEKLDRVDLQGDGVKSFVGVVLYALLSRRDVLLIDEPEAFLHPPQARVLGRMLAAELNSATQMFCATHSGDFLKGLLDSDRGNVHVVRVTRSNGTNPVRVLEKSEVMKVWKDPLLRYSNILDAVFHQGVIICESDSDCRFYAAIADRKPGAGEPQRDLMFAHCGGKHRIPMVIKALAALEVPFAAIVDFDVLREEATLKSIFETCGGAWTDIEGDWICVTNAINSKSPEHSRETVIKNITDEMAQATGTVFPSVAADKIKKMLRQGSPWSIAKGIGKTYLPSGGATLAYERMLVELTAKGVFVVPVGELESFAKSVGGHGPSWVNTVLETKDLDADEELLEARRFTDAAVRSVLK